MTNSIAIRVGDIVTRTGDCRPWRVVAVYPELGFARLEFVGDAWVKSATADLDQIVLQVLGPAGPSGRESDERCW